MIYYYTLNSDGRTPVPVDDVLEWAQWMEASFDRRILARTAVPGGYVSTVFLGIDMGLSFVYSDVPPLLWETMAFIEGEADSETRRYATYEEAVDGHREVVELFTRGLPHDHDQREGQ